LRIEVFPDFLNHFAKYGKDQPLKAASIQPQAARGDKEWWICATVAGGRLIQKYDGVKIYYNWKPDDVSALMHAKEC